MIVVLRSWLRQIIGLRLTWIGLRPLGGDNQILRLRRRMTTLGIGSCGVGGCCEVDPGWVYSGDQRELFSPCEVLEIFLAGDCVVDVLETFDIDEAMDAVAPGETVVFAFTVLGDAAGEVAGDADVEGSGAAAEDVDVVVVLFRHRWEGKREADPPLREG